MGSVRSCSGADFWDRPLRSGLLLASFLRSGRWLAAGRSRLGRSGLDGLWTAGLCDGLVGVAGVSV